MAKPRGVMFIFSVNTCPVLRVQCGKGAQSGWPSFNVLLNRHTGAMPPRHYVAMDCKKNFFDHRLDFFSY